tara:strand:- start:2505 stop:3596 length:1092 start_codon:yes stop_codon:yes gene_type:complete
MQRKTLYKKDSKGKTRVWTIWTVGDTIFTEHGVLNGELQIANKRAIGKNIGKANETSPKEQAALQAKSMHSKKKDKGYYENLKDTGKFRVSPMLAHKWEPTKQYKWSYPIDVQPKLDGVRCLAYWDNDNVVLMSRGGKEYTAPHISDELSKRLPKTTILDGELYAHDISFQSFMSLAKRNRKESSALQYCVYDALDKGSLLDSWENRKWYLEDLFKKELAVAKHTELVPTVEAKNDADVERLHSEFVSNGFEGAIMRIRSGVYRLGHRSRELLKVKSFDDNEFEIVDFSEGVGKDKGCVVWVCQTTKGQRFSVRPRGTYEQRKEWHNDGDLYIGDMLTVRYQGLSDDNIPRFPVGIIIREDHV